MVLKGEILLTVRGVFFIFLFLYSLTSSSCGATDVISCSLTGSYQHSSENWQNTLTNELTLDITPKHKLSGQLLVTKGTMQPLEVRCANWSFLTQLNAQQELEMLYNKPHLTSTDIFRVLHQDYYSGDHLAIIHRYDQYLLGLLAWRVPIKNGLPSTVHYVQLEYPQKLTNLKLTAMHYDSQHQWASFNTKSWDFCRQVGQILVGEVQTQLAPCDIHFGYGYQKRTEEIQTKKQVFHDHAWVCTTKTDLEPLRISIALQYIGQEFDWPLTKTKPYASNRKGYTSQLRWTSLPWKATLSHNRLTNIDATRRYDHSSLKLEYRQADRVIFCTTNLVPQQSMRFGYKKGAFTTEWQYSTPQIWLSYAGKDHEVKYTSSSFNRHRIEYRYTGLFSFKAVFKADQHTNQHYLYWSLNLNDQQKHLAITYGEDDRGQIGAKFGHAPSLQLAWGWSW